MNDKPLLIDLGNGYSAEWVGWSPDRSIPANAERFADVPDIEKAMLSIRCPHGTGGIQIDSADVRAVFPDGPFWQLISEDPLHVEPSIHRLECGCHGFIREGKWVNA
jgi:hypothetical protein